MRVFNASNHRLKLTCCHWKKLADQNAEGVTALCRTIVATARLLCGLVGVQFAQLEGENSSQLQSLLMLMLLKV
jgi:hypothetical protein